MIMLIRQELYKMFKRKKTYVVIIGFILLTFFIAYGDKQHSEYMKEYSTPEFQVENIKSNIEYMERDLEQIPENIKNDEAEKARYVENIQQEIARLEEELKLQEKQINSDLTWEEALAQEIESKEEIIEELKSHPQSDEMSHAKMDLEELKYLQENNIEPREYYDFNAFTFLESLTNQLGQVFLVIGIAVFAADIVSGEWTPPTLKLLLTQPVSRGKILLSKFIATIIAAVGLILFIEILSFIAVGLLYGFGDLNYPMIVDKIYELDTSIRLEDGSHPLALIEGGYNIIPALTYGVRLLLNQALVIITISSFVFMISSLVKSSMVSMGASVVSLIGGTIILQLSNLLGLKKYVFLTYTVSSEVMNGNLGVHMHNPSITNTLAIVVLAAWAAMCYLISHIAFTKRDLLV